MLHKENNRHRSLKITSMDLIRVSNEDDSRLNQIKFSQKEILKTMEKELITLKTKVYHPSIQKILDFKLPKPLQQMEMDQETQMENQYMYIITEA